MEYLLLIPLMLGAAAFAVWPDPEPDEVAEADEPDADLFPDLLAEDDAPIRLVVSDMLGAEIAGQAVEGGTQVSVDGAPALVVMDMDPDGADAWLAALGEAGAFDEA